MSTATTVQDGKTNFLRKESTFFFLFFSYKKKKKKFKIDQLKKQMKMNRNPNPPRNYQILKRKFRIF